LYKEIIKSILVKDSVPVLITDSKNQIIFCTKKASSILGKKQSDLINSKFLYTKKKKIIIAGKNKNDVICFIHSIPLKYKNEYYVVFQLILDKKYSNLRQNFKDAASEAALRESEERFKLVIEGSRLGFWDWNLKTGEMKRNEYWAQMLGYSLSELKPTIDQWTELIHPADKESVWQSVQDHLNGKTSMYKVECRLRSKKGEYKWILDLGRIVEYNSTGKPLRFSGIHTDITERKNSELALKDSQDRYLAFLEHSSEGIHRLEFIKPIDINLPVETQIDYFYEYGYVAEHNKIFELMYNTQENKKLIGLSLEEFHGSRDNQVNRGAIRKLIENGYRITDEETEEKKFDGSTVYFLNNTAGIIENNKLFRIWGTQTDITERKKVQEELIKAKEKAELSNKLKSEFLAQVSHEIRTPLNVTLSYSELIKDSLGDCYSQEQNEYIEAINLAGKRLIRTVDLILNTSEMQVGSYEPIWSKIDLEKDTIEPIRIEMQKYANKKKIKMNVKYDTPGSFIIADQYSVSQIFINLIDNAIKYTEKGLVEIVIDKNSNNEVVVSINDTGIGMSEDFLNNIFAPFVQEERGYSRKFEGSGLGLSLVKRYCDLNSASIGVESRKGKGTKFVVTFQKR
jgi:PAS domain S-box-containing protein